MATSRASRKTAAARSRSVMVAIGVHLAQQRVDALGRGGDLVGLEPQLGRDLEVDLAPELAAKMWRGRAERGTGAGSRLGVAEHRVIDPRDVQVGRDLH